MADFEVHPSKKANIERMRQSQFSFQKTHSFATRFSSIDKFPAPANQNLTKPIFTLTNQLPREIQLAVKEWAEHLKTIPWELRKRAIRRFSETFADNFLLHIPNLTPEEYDSLANIGTTCVLELLDDGSPIRDVHQARCYLDSVHHHHQIAAHELLNTKNIPTKGLH